MRSATRYFRGPESYFVAMMMCIPTLTSMPGGGEHIASKLGPKFVGFQITVGAGVLESESSQLKYLGTYVRICSNGHSRYPSKCRYPPGTSVGTNMEGPSSIDVWYSVHQKMTKIGGGPPPELSHENGDGPWRGSQGTGAQRLTHGAKLQPLGPVCQLSPGPAFHR